MKIKELLEARNAIPTQNTAASLQTKYKLAKFLAATSGDLSYYTEEYNKILSETAEPQEHGFVDAEGLIHFSKENGEEFRRRVADLDAVEVDAPAVTFTFAELEPLELSIDAVGKLYCFIKEEE